MLLNKNSTQYIEVTKAHFICPVLKTELQIRRSIIGERPPNWSDRKLLMCHSVIRMVNKPFWKPLLAGEYLFLHEKMLCENHSATQNVLCELAHHYTVCKQHSQKIEFKTDLKERDLPSHLHINWPKVTQRNRLVCPWDLPKPDCCWLFHSFVGEMESGTQWSFQTDSGPVNADDRYQCFLT